MDIKTISVIRTTRGAIGLTLAEDKQGQICAAEVIDDEPAAKDGGLKRGDVILEVWLLNYYKCKVGRCSSSLLAAGRAELQRTQLKRSSRRHIEGAAGCRLTTQGYGAQLRWKGWLSIYFDPQPTLSTFQVGGNRSTRRKPTTFGRALTYSNSHMSVASPSRDSNLTIAPPKPLETQFVVFGRLYLSVSFTKVVETL